MNGATPPSGVAVRAERRAAARTARRPRMARTAAAGMLLAVLAGSAAAQSPGPGVPSPAVPTTGGPALAPTDGPPSDRLRADGTALTTTPRVVIAPTRPLARPQDAAPDPDGAATLLAERVELSGSNVITASGGVVVWFEGARLVAERLVYDGDAGTMTIDGPIHLTEPGKAGTPDETVLIADAAQMDEGLRDGLLKGARLVLAREMQLAAAEVRRSGGGEITTLDHVVASSCQVCAANPVPLWEIRARRITHDARTHRLQFDRPQLRAFGLPLATLPALSAPDPTVERMSGFLAPRFRTTSSLGPGIMVPYFLTLGDSADLTVTPYVSTSRTATLGVRYRQAFTTGSTEWNGAVTRDDIRDGTRGYLFGAAAFALPRDYRLGLQVQMASDRAYLLDYDITDADRLWSGATLERVRRDRLVTGRVGNYRTFREGEDQATSPGLVADALWDRRYGAGPLGGELGVQFSAHAHRRDSSRDVVGRDIARASARLEWQRTALLGGGVVASATARVDADLYRIHDDSRFDSSEARAFPVAAVEFRWPLIARSGAAVNLLEPVAQIVWSPELDGSDIVPDEDSGLAEFDEGNLFALDRLPGRDAVEQGLRANLGIGWTRIDPTGWSLGLTAGRIVHANDDRAFSRNGMVLTGKRSDWLVSATYSGPDGIALANRTLLDEDFAVNRNELRLGVLRPGFQLSGGYLWIDSHMIDGQPRDVSELTATTGWQVSPGWWASAETRYDFVAQRAQKAELGLTYRNECVSVDMSLSRRFTSSDDVRADTDLGLAVRLGGFGRRTDEMGPGTVARRTCLR